MTHKNKTQLQVSTKNIKKKINNIDYRPTFPNKKKKKKKERKKRRVIERSKSRSSEKIDALF